MATLADLLLEVDGEVFGVSWPVEGDVTLPEQGRRNGRPRTRLSFGASAQDIPRLERLTGRVARVLDLTGREISRITIEKVDRKMEVVVANVASKPLPQPKPQGVKSSVHAEPPSPDGVRH